MNATGKLDGSTMMLRVLTLTGDEHEIDVEPTDKVAKIKEKLEEKEGIPPLQQRLIYQGKKLKDDETIQSYKLSGGTVLHLVVALRGGYELLPHRKGICLKYSH